MTREEAINKWIIPAIKNTWNEKKCNEILKALEQEPCDDCISRQAAIDAIKKSRFLVDAMEKVIKLSPVQPKMGRWLKELKAHREAWAKAKRTVKAYLILEGFGSEYQDDIEKLIDGCIPKEGDNE